MLSYYNHELSVCGVRDLCYNCGKAFEEVVYAAAVLALFFHNDTTGGQVI